MVFLQILTTVDYLHTINIAHCDLKFENILYDEDTGELKLIDFGFSIDDPENNPPTFLCGTPSYMAPEEIMKKNIDVFKADIWSLGVILFKMATGLFPFRGKLGSNFSKNRSRPEQENTEGRVLDSDLCPSLSSPEEVSAADFEPCRGQAAYDSRDASRRLVFGGGL